MFMDVRSAFTNSSQVVWHWPFLKHASGTGVESQRPGKDRGNSRDKAVATNWSRGSVLIQTLRVPRKIWAGVLIPHGREFLSEAKTSSVLLSLGSLITTYVREKIQPCSKFSVYLPPFPFSNVLNRRSASSFETSQPIKCCQLLQVSAVPEVTVLTKQLAGFNH